MAIQLPVVGVAIAPVKYGYVKRSLSFNDRVEIFREVCEKYYLSLDMTVI